MLHMNEVMLEIIHEQRRIPDEGALMGIDGIWVRQAARVWFSHVLILLSL